MNAAKILAVAPMMAWTDRHCRYLHRLYSPSALLFTEMVTTGALKYGKRWDLLRFHEAEHPVALQLGGSDPADLALCAREAERLGFDEINLNVGCPSDRVQNGAFGACLMLKPELVRDCMKAIGDAVSIPISVKCRLGVDDHDSDTLLADFLGTVSTSGCQKFYLHARKAILSGLTPAQNREVPPLQYERAEKVKRDHPHYTVVLNGGITSVEAVTRQLEWADGVMIGRSAYNNPALLAECEQHLFNPGFAVSLTELIRTYTRYAHTQLEEGARLNTLTKPLLHTMNGQRGARRFRRILSDAQRLKTGDATLIEEALAAVFEPRFQLVHA